MNLIEALARYTRAAVACSSPTALQTLDQARKRVSIYNVWVLLVKSTNKGMGN